MEKRDLKKELKHLYRASAKAPVEVDVPAFRYLMIDGEGSPDSPQYRAAVEALFTVSYTTKFAIKKGPEPVDYAVMPLEGLWWANDMSVFTTDDKSAWKWTMMILQPDFIPDDVITASIDTVRTKKKIPAVDRLRLERFEEGRCAQLLHVGPFSEEGPTVESLHSYINARASLRGKHHEIYLSDIRRAAPDKWKTIIRQPMACPLRSKSV